MSPGQRSAPVLNQEPQPAWPMTLIREDAGEALFEFETLLKAVERFCNLANHPARSSGPVSLQDSLAVELAVFDRQLRRLIQLCQGLIDEAHASALIFQSYIESQWVSDDERDHLLRNHLDQATPLESLFALLGGLHSLAELTAAMRETKGLRIPTFRALGDLYRMVIVQNRFFNPLARNPFDRVWQWREHPIIRGALRQAPSENLRRALAFLVLIIARYLKILSWIRPRNESRDALLDSIPLFALIHSELRSLRAYLETTLARRFFPAGCVLPAEEEFLSRADAMAFELSLEVEKAFKKMLLDYGSCRRLLELRGRIESAHGLLTASFEGAVVSFLQVVAPSIEARNIFPDYSVRLAQSVRLREDLWVFSEVLASVIGRIADPNLEPFVKRRSYRGLIDFLTYFENLSFQLVRHTEYDSFRTFFEEIRSLRDGPFSEPDACSDIAANFDCFRIFLETVLSQVNNRACLQGVPFDRDHARSNLKKFLP